ncbi:MAG: acyl-CoA carboxylase [Streptosporangiales bacterium]|nr:acyl-CoA carboxylase [Streptosporangiales bacterium]
MTQTTNSAPPLLDLVEEVNAQKAAVLDAARPDAVAAQRGRGRWTARERVDALLDPGSFAEIGQLAAPTGTGELMRDVDAPADGVVVGRGLVDGRPVVVVSYDFTVLGGSMGHVNDEKFSRARHVALRNGVPLIIFAEGAGARINERMGSTTIRGHERFSDLSLLSGWVPIVCGVPGPAFAGHANLVALSDFCVMTKGSALGLAGPRLVEAATGERATAEEMGGSTLHATELGSVELEVPDEAALVDAIKTYLGYLPTNAGQSPPRHSYSPTESERLPDKVLRLVPDNPNTAYDMRRLVRLVLDPGSGFELKPTHARNVVTTFGRLGGHPVGVIANNPMFLAGALDTPASDKMARFINVCDAYGLPLIFLADVPGYLVGTAAERTNIARHSMRPLWELGQSTVPVLTIVIRKAYGLAYHTMGGAEFHPELMACWPTAAVSPMGADGATNVIYGHHDQTATAQRAEVLDQFRDLEHPIHAARHAKIDDIIDPRDTRSALLATLQHLALADHHTGHWHPPKKRGITPV